MTILLFLFTAFLILILLLFAIWFNRWTTALAFLAFWCLALMSPEVTGFFFLVFAGLLLFAFMMVTIADYIADLRRSAHRPSGRTWSKVAGVKTSANKPEDNSTAGWWAWFADRRQLPPPISRRRSRS